MKIRILLMAAVLTGLLFSLFASAEIACTCSNPITTDVVCLQVPADGSLGTDINAVLNIPKFDSSLGCLQSVRMTSKSCGYIWAQVDSEAQFPVDWEVTAISGVQVTLPGGLGNKLVQFGTLDGPVIISTAKDDPTELPLGSPFNPDYQGLDWGRIDFGSPEAPICSEITEFTFNSEADKQLFIGSAGETLPVTVESEGEAGAKGASSNVGFISFAQMNATVCVEYTYCPRLCINGTKIDDCTGLGIEGWEICLTKPDGTKVCTTTDENGDYSFCDLDRGTYTVSEEVRDGWLPMDPTSRVVTLVAANENDVNFHNKILYCIRGTKTRDCDNTPVADMTINLKDSTGATIKTTVTDADGNYEFCGLMPGDYTVEEFLPAGWVQISAPGPIKLVCEDENGQNFVNQEPLCIRGTKTKESFEKPPIEDFIY